MSVIDVHVHTYVQLSQAIYGYSCTVQCINKRKPTCLKCLLVHNLSVDISWLSPSKSHVFSFCDVKLVPANAHKSFPVYIVTQFYVTE